MAPCQPIGNIDDILSGAATVVRQEDTLMTPIVRTALITGGSRGLGRALGRALAARGAAVVVVARTATELEQAVAEMRRAGGEAYGIVADVADKDAVYRIAGEAAALVGAVDLLVHNASELGPTPLRSLLDTECEDLARVLEVNLIGPFRLTKAIVGPMLLAGRGTVLLISSDAAVEPYPHWGAYGVSKAALDHLGRIWAAELAGTGVRVVTVDPGEMDTRMHADAVPDADRSALAAPDAVAERIVSMLTHADRAPSGARLVADRWEVHP
jgi:NAD(P)-dependent dehydrogenase (short-subunit alcohol dehydrogenase family)